MTTYVGSAVAGTHIDELSRILDRSLIEEALEAMPSIATGAVAPDGIALAIASAWLSEHLALVALGLAKVEVDSPNQITIKPSGTGAIAHLRRLWFASAFEELSLRKAQMSLEVYAYLAAGGQDISGEVETAFFHALSLFPQHWRLPVEEGPVGRLMENHLWPLILLAGAALQAERDGTRRPILRADFPTENFRMAFDAVLKDQTSRKLFDRAFDVRNGGLILGPRKLAPGLLLIAEKMAYELLGPNWHNKELSNTQKRYLLGRLRDIPHVQTIDVGIEKHDTSDGTHVDVDFFVRDKQQGILFAVQLKHLEYSDKGGMRYWISRFAHVDRGLAYGITQLEAFKSLAKSDSKVREKLLSSGIQSNELDHVVPVVLHNVGVMDCLAFQEGILVYDQQTFVNVLDGRPAIGVGVVDGQAVHFSRKGSPTACRLDDPDTVISAYAGDPHFATIEHFSVAADVTRHLSVLGSTVRAEGLGI